MLCVGHKRNVNTVYASPVVTPTSTHRWVLTKQKKLFTSCTLSYYPELAVFQLVKHGANKE